jgi:hypothetical protein
LSIDGAAAFAIVGLLSKGWAVVVMAKIGLALADFF